MVLTLGPAGLRDRTRARRPASTPGTMSAAAPGHHPAKRAIKLVSYQGYQAPGYQVSEVPRGWVVQGSNAFALTVAPADDPDKFVDSFVGKIAVMLKSRDEPAPKGQPNLPVACRPGFLDRQGDTWILLYQDPSGQWVDIQFPAKLGWDRAQFARFAAGRQGPRQRPARPRLTAGEVGWRPGQPAPGTGTESSSSRSRE